MEWLTEHLITSEREFHELETLWEKVKGQKVFNSGIWTF